MTSPSRSETPPLSTLTSLRLGGPPARLIEGRSDAEIIAAVKQADAEREPLLILGGASNVVVADEGFAGTALVIRSRGIKYVPAGEDRVRVEAAAGEVWDELVAACVDRGLAGIECLSGIPGSVGATPIQNVGAYGQEVADTIVAVHAYDRLADELVELEPEACEFGYRDSNFKHQPGRWVVLRVDFELERSDLSRPIRYAELAKRLGRGIGDQATLPEVREAVLELRGSKGLLNGADEPESATAGSFFTNPVLNKEQAETLRRRARELGPKADPPLFRQPEGGFKTSAAWLIQNAGFYPGYGDPEGIAISSYHCLVLTNRGKGTTAGLMDLAREIAAGVREKFDVELHPEPTLVGHEW